MRTGSFVFAAAALSALSAHPVHAAHPARGRALVERSTCAACHGKDLNTPISADYPKLAGQHADYLYITMRAYQNGGNSIIGRKNPIMAAQMQNFSQRDLRDIAAYIESLPGDLVLKKEGPMRILLSNDDGYLAPGLAALYQLLQPLGEVLVFAPERNCSGASNSLTLSRPLSIWTAENGFRYLNGTPTDCVHIALTGVLDTQPDLVISGINDGQNMGEDTLYSGTVAAATEGFMFGVPAFAFSLADKGWAHLDAAARTAADIIAHYLKMPLPAPFLLNINIPNRPYHEMGRWRVTRLGKRHPSQPVIPQTNPRGQPIYWSGASGDVRDRSDGTDSHAVERGEVSITPLQLDLTDQPMLATVSEWAHAAALLF